MRKLNSLFFVLTSIFIISCNQTIEKTKTIAFPVKQKLDAGWLLGKWKYEDENGMLHEDWRRKNDTVFIGESYFIEKNDTLFFEHLQLILNGDSIIYESLGEDKTKTKSFSGLYLPENNFEVSNLQHSFPRTIRYNSLADTLLVIEISGFIDGSEETQPYHMVKVD